MFKSRKEAVDAFQKLYEERMDLERQAKLVKAQEDAVKGWIQAQLLVSANPTTKDFPRVLATTMGTEWLAELVEGVEATLENFDKFSKFVADNRAKGSFGLLYRRLNQDSIRTWQGEGIRIPGLGSVRYYKLHHRKRE